MEMQKVTFHSRDFHKIKKLYQTSFPKEERIPFWFLMLRTRFPDAAFLACYEQGKLCGICCFNRLEGHTNLLYLAVEPTMRSLGYGSRILQTMQMQDADRTIALDIERVDPQAKNYQERYQRKQFYLRNGYTSSGYGYTVFHVDYEILKIGEFDPAMWLKVARHLYLGTLHLTLYPIDEL